jgi:hypothetical protein
VERKRLYDMAMELHELQRRGTDIANTLAPLTRQMTELNAAMSSRSDIPADVKSSFDAFNKELTALAAKVTPPAGGRGFGGGGGGRGGAVDNVITKLGQAKNAMMAGMWPTEQTIRYYNESKTDVPKAVADVNALLAKANALSATLVKYNLMLTVPAAMK